MAQHYGLPTRAMDWSYDYKVSLYFAVRDVLSNNTNDGVLWAFNYKLLENNKPQDKDFFTNLFVYRPEYNINPNLTAQKGVFTFLDLYTENYEKPLDEIISLELNQKPENRPFNQEDNVKITTLPINVTKKDTIFYKFIIPKEIKHEILKELYLAGYSEEYLFPGYSGVAKSIINRVKLKKMSKKPHIAKENILLSIKWDINKIKNKKIKYEFEKTPINENINKIFICKNNEVFGYFKRNEIIKDSPQKLWEGYGKLSEFSHEKFKNYFKDKEYGFAINTNNLKIFDYPITIRNFRLETNFYVIEDNNDLKFLLNFK